MRVILLQDVKGVGRRFEVKNMSDGYARNFLIPRGLAKLATETELRDLEKQKALSEKEDAALRERLLVLKRTLESRTLEFYVKTSDQGTVFGSVNKDMILKALRDSGLLGKERVGVTLPHPLKELGEHKILLDFKKGITGDITVKLLPQT